MRYPFSLCIKSGEPIDVSRFDVTTDNLHQFAPAHLTFTIVLYCKCKNCRTANVLQINQEPSVDRKMLWWQYLQVVTVEDLEGRLVWRDPLRTGRVFGAGFYFLICLRHLMNGPCSHLNPSPFSPFLGSGSCIHCNFPVFWTFPSPNSSIRVSLHLHLKEEGRSIEGPLFWAGGALKWHIDLRASGPQQFIGCKLEIAMPRWPVKALFLFGILISPFKTRLKVIRDLCRHRDHPAVHCAGFLCHLLHTVQLIEERVATAQKTKWGHPTPLLQPLFTLSYVHWQCQTE